MLSRLVLVTALLAGLAMLIQAPARAAERDQHLRHERYVEVRRGPAYYDAPRPAYYPPHYRPAPAYRPRAHYHGERYRHQHRHHQHRDHYYGDRRW
ncbi:hypothetical protein [Pseudomonas oryzae]|uniref:PXPV repeat-containing protein n=1 Tax=Pseudomonas oryzae TaxID=1392877 RepID=A0A1H1YQ49_9PSED|nr:hypothetical protein [Pseudomonas oryzae]SDT23574.1 hypothetical protein SAMN05216221_3888 [Pseudomonas oryzae]